MEAARQYNSGELVPGTIYRVLRHLATGGMGSVYDVEDTTVGKRYVLKTLHPNLVSRGDLARRMAAEARALGRLSHPNIVEVVTAGQTSDPQPLPFYVMERLNGNNLRSVLEKRGALPEDQVLPIATELLDALDHAHEHQVVHRDVKPENIFLHRAMTGGVVTKLLDFGIMRMVDESRANDTAGRFVGTLRYAAPEQILGGQVGPGTDLYAAAIVIYEMLAGRGPFDDAFDISRLGYAHINEKPPPLSKLAKVSPELERVVMAGLEKSPTDRPRDAFSFAGQLKAIAKRDTRKVERAQETATDVHVLSQLPANAVPARPVRGVDLAEAVTVAAGQHADAPPSAPTPAHPQPVHDPALPYAQTAMSDAGVPGYAATLPDSHAPSTLQSHAGQASVRPAAGVDRHADTRSISPKSAAAMGIGSTERLANGPASNRASHPPALAQTPAPYGDRASIPSFVEASSHAPVVHHASVGVGVAQNTTAGGAELASRPRERITWTFFALSFLLMLVGGGAAIKVVVLPRILGDGAPPASASAAAPLPPVTESTHAPAPPVASASASVTVASPVSPVPAIPASPASPGQPPAPASHRAPGPTPASGKPVQKPVVTPSSAPKGESPSIGP